MEPKKPIINLGRLSGAGKWVTVSVTTVAAIIGILVNARNLGLTPWLNVGAISFADLAARRVLLAPATDTLRAVGDTLHLAATVTDEHGATLAGATILWSTNDSAVAIVDSSGSVIARGPGTAMISASVRELNAHSRITVWQRVRSVSIAHDTLLRLPEGAAVQLVARALDARGHPVQGRAVRWASADSSVVAVNDAGAAVAGAPGRTSLTASTDNYSATIPAEVALTAASIKLIGGQDQRAPAARRLTQPVQVQVTSRAGRPVPDALVTFTTEGGEGTVGSETTSTDRAGRARTSWTLGPHAGRQKLMISVGGVDSTLTVMAEADPVPGKTRVQLSGDALAGSVGAPLPEPVAIRVTDDAGAAVADVPVTWTALDGGKIEPLAARTDSLGEARANWVLGSRAGSQRVRAQVGNPRTMPPFTVTASALAETPASLALVSGGNQEGRVGASLKSQVVVRVLDRNGNPVSGGTIRASALGGSVSDSAPMADNHGQVAIKWTLGSKAGPQSLELAPDSGPSIRVTARALPLEPANIAVGSLPASSAAGRPLAKPITVTVTDAYGNIVPNVQVIFGVSAGSAAPLRVMTDAKGQATTRWTLGSSAGDQTATATIKGTAAKMTLVVAATRPGAARAAPPKPPTVKAAPKR